MYACCSAMIAGRALPISGKLLAPLARTSQSRRASGSEADHSTVDSSSAGRENCRERSAAGMRLWFARRRVKQHVVPDRIFPEQSNATAN